MSESHTHEQTAKKVLAVALRIPGVRIERAKYLRGTLQRKFPDEQISEAIKTSPKLAGISEAALEEAARASIRMETTSVTTISAAAGIPGGLVMIGTVPADSAQYFGHMLRISQKLAYLYGWPDLFAGDEDEIDDATLHVLIVFLGVMMGAHAATQAVDTLSRLMAQQAVKKLPQQALTKGIVYPMVKKIAQQLGVRMTKQIFARGVSRLVPIVGAVASGTLTLATFTPMSHRLRKHLADSGPDTAKV